MRAPLVYMPPPFGIIWDGLQNWLSRVIRMTGRGGMRLVKPGTQLTPIKTVDELLACRPARMEPIPGKKMLKMKQQMPVALGTEGT